MSLWNSFMGRTSSCFAELSWISSRFCPFQVEFNFHTKHSLGVISGEYSGCRTWRIFCLEKKYFTIHCRWWNPCGVLRWLYPVHFHSMHSYKQKMCVTTLEFLVFVESSRSISAKLLQFTYISSFTITAVQILFDQISYR